MRKTSHSRPMTINNKKSKEDITNEFSSHFDNLLNTPRININADKTEQSTNELHVPEDSIQSYITNNDVINGIKSINLNKSSDPFSITAEHFHFAISSDFLINFLTDL